jgi:hypothetical protein
MRGKSERSVKTCSKNAPSWGIDELLNETNERVRGYTHQEILVPQKRRASGQQGSRGRKLEEHVRLLWITRGCPLLSIS